MNKIIKIFVLVLAVTFASCQNPTSKSKSLPSDHSIVGILKAELTGLDLQNPEDDLRVNVAKGDYRFIGIYGYALFCPGTEELSHDQIEKYGIRPIKGTSDAVVNEEHGKLIESAIQYAKHYNRALIRELKRRSD